MHFVEWRIYHWVGPLGGGRMDLHASLPFFVQVLQLVQYRSFQLGFLSNFDFRLLWENLESASEWFPLAPKVFNLSIIVLHLQIYGMGGSHILFISYFENVYIGSDESTLTVAGILMWQQFSYFYENTTTKRRTTASVQNPSPATKQATLHCCWKKTCQWFFSDKFPLQKCKIHFFLA